MNRTNARIKTVELRFGETAVVNKKYYLPRDPEILAAITKGLQIPAATTEIASGFSFTGLTTTFFTTTMMKNCTLTLCNEKGDELYKDLVPFTFYVAGNGGQLRQWMNAKIDTSKSYIKFQDVTGVTSTTVMLLEFFINE